MRDAVGQEARTYPAVLSVSLLGYCVLGAPAEGPGAEVWDSKSPDVLIVDETEAVLCVLDPVFVLHVVGDIGVHVGDGCGGEVNRQAGPVVAIPVNGEEKGAI